MRVDARSAVHAVCPAWRSCRACSDWAARAQFKLAPHVSNPFTLRRRSYRFAHRLAANSEGCIAMPQQQESIASHGQARTQWWAVGRSRLPSPWVRVLLDSGSSLAIGSTRAGYYKETGSVHWQCSFLCLSFFHLKHPAQPMHIPIWSGTAEVGGGPWARH